MSQIITRYCDVCDCMMPSGTMSCHDEVDECSTCAVLVFEHLEVTTSGTQQLLIQIAIDKYILDHALPPGIESTIKALQKIYAMGPHEYDI